MIISASKRTDIPAFHSSWFMDNLKRGYFETVNPYNGFKSKVEVSPDIVDCIVFWTKDATSMMKYIPKLMRMGYIFYFQYTVNLYPKIFEPNKRDATDIISNFIELSDLIGKDRVIWRYDPIFFSEYTVFPGKWNECIESINHVWHYSHFDTLLNYFNKSTNKCIISFIDIYGKLIDMMNKLGITSPAERQIHNLARYFQSHASSNNIKIETCSEIVDLSEYDIGKASCIDINLIQKLSGRELKFKSAKQRPQCGCMYAVDIGHYNTCNHGCVYCYANK